MGGSRVADNWRAHDDTEGHTATGGRGNKTQNVYMVGGGGGTRPPLTPWMHHRHLAQYEHYLF